MTKLNGPVPADTIRALRGTIDFACWKGIHYARKWPRPVRDTITPANIQNISDFRSVIGAVNAVGGSEKAEAIEIAKGTQWTWRDVLTVAAYDKLIEWPDPTP